MPALAPQYSLGSTDAELRRLIDLASHEQDRVADRELEVACHRPDVQWVSSPIMFEWIARKR